MAPAKKIFITELFFYRWKIENKLKFAKWYRKKQEDKFKFEEISEFTKKYFSFGSIIINFEQLLVLIDTFLSKGVDKIKLTVKNTKMKSRILSA